VTPRTLAPADRARRRAAVARTPGLSALERVDAEWAQSERLLLLRLWFVPDAGAGPAAPSGVKTRSVRLHGPAGRLPVVWVGEPEGDGRWLDAKALGSPEGAGEGGYRLELVDVPGVDPHFATATFHLGTTASTATAEVMEEEAGEAPGAPVDPEAPLSASIDYLTKDYSTFRAQMLDRMAVTLPSWTERNPADIGVMLVEVLAYAADYLSYYQDAAATETYLGTARLRTSLARHARLLDYPVNEGCSAVAWVQVRVGDAGIVLPKGTRFYTRTGQDVTCLVPGTAAHTGALREQPLAFETLEPLAADPNLNEIALYTWGAEQYALPVGATTATLLDAWVAGKRALDGLKPGDVLVLQEQRSVTGGPPDPSHRQAVRLLWVERRVDPAARELAGDSSGTAGTGGSGSPPAGGLRPVPVVEVGWHDGDALTFPLVVAGNAGGVPYTGGVVALGNLVLADHGGTSGPYPLLPVTVPGVYRPRLPVAGISRRPPFDPRLYRLLPAADATVRDPGKALAEVWLKDGQGRDWHTRRDLLGSTPFSRDFVVEPAEDATSSLRFGDGELGLAPPPGTRFTLTCRTGMGVMGNVGRDVLGHLETPAAGTLQAQRLVNGVLQVRNPLPSTGGSGSEPGYRVRARAPQAYHVQARAATPGDWVALALDQPQVRAAASEAGWEGVGPQDRVWVQRQQGFPEDDPFLGRVRAGLEPYRPAGRSLRVLPPSYVGIDVELRVQLDPDVLRSAAEKALLQAIVQGPTALFNRARLTFGQAVWLSQVVAAAAGVAGVTWVQPLAFQRWSPYPQSAQVAEELAMGAHEVARLDDDASKPWNGSLTLELQGGLG
jgi:uncharacterized phage protein gp47/JayE